ncbi:31456_t:CDS:2, partial [Racocetra persica]
PYQFWQYVKDEVPELAYISQHIFFIVVNFASVERLFSDMEFIHSKRQNRFNRKKIIKIAQLRANQHIRKQEKVYKQANNVNIENEIISNECNTDEEESEEYDEEYDQVHKETDEIYNNRILYPANNPKTKWEL